MLETFAALGAVCFAAGCCILVAPPLARMAGSVLLRHARALDSAYNAYASEWKKEARMVQ